MKKATKKARPAAPSCKESVASDAQDVAGSTEAAVLAPPVVSDQGDDDEDGAVRAPRVRTPVSTEPNLKVRLSDALYQKLKRSSEDEGIGIDAFVTELLSEGVVLRAWEIIQRNSAMRGPATQQGPGSNFRGGNAGGPPHQGQSRHGNQGGGYNGQSNNRPRPAPNNAWMEDKAAFLEYVRNQEKRRR